MTEFDGKAFGEAIVAAVTDYVRRAIAPLESRIKELEAVRTKNLADAFRGSWQPNNQYERGHLITDRGSTWICMTDTSARPGETDHWRLVVKAGKDGRDAR